MGTTLTGTTPQDTYDSLIKVTDNGPISGTAKFLSDGLGNDSKLALSTGNVGVNTTTPAAQLDVAGTLKSAATVQGVSASVGLIQNAKADFSNGRVLDLQFTNAQAYDGGDVTAFLLCANASTTVARINALGGAYFAGNVGIGTLAPSNKLTVKGTVTLFNDEVSAGYTTLDIVPATAIGASANRIAALNTTDIAFETGGAERFRITNNGVTFNGDTAAANALDDYEEGTWTMGVSFGGASVGVVYGVRTGTYTKVGRQVTVNGYMSLTSKGSSTGNVLITGLPFTVANGTNFYAPASTWQSAITFADVLLAYADVNSTTIALEQATNLGVTVRITNTNFTDTSAVMFNCTYFV